MKNQKVIDLTFGLICGSRTVNPWDVMHRHDEVELTFFLSDKPVIYRFGGRQFEIQSEETLLFWGAIPHQLVDITPKNLQYWLTVPPEILFRWDLPSDKVRDVLDGKILVERDQKLRKLDLLSFPIWEMEASSEDVRRRKTMALSVEARFRRLMESQSPGEGSVGFTPPYLITRDKNAFMTMYDFITLNFHRDIRIADISSAAGVHPNYATTLFRQKCGINIIDFITMLRVYEAQRLLLTTDMKIIDVAMEAGFGSMSNFYKYFRKVCRRNPKEYRKRLSN